MTNPTDELIERLEAVSGDDLLLYRHVTDALWGDDTDNLPDDAWRYEEWLNKGAFIQAGLGLIPDGWDIQGLERSTGGRWTARLVTCHQPNISAIVRRVQATGEVPAAALIAAALKARNPQ